MATVPNNNYTPRPLRLTRQIGSQHWMVQLKNMINNDLQYTLVSYHHTGWVYLIQKEDDVRFKCMTYKLSSNPFDIKDELYNYTITNGNLISSKILKRPFYNSINYL